MPKAQLLATRRVQPNQYFDEAVLSCVQWSNEKSAEAIANELAGHGWVNVTMEEVEQALYRLSSAKAVVLSKRTDETP